jgi:hypothetical protein
VTENQLLYIVLCVLYLSECVYPIYYTSIAFVRVCGDRWVYINPCYQNSYCGFSFILANPLPSAITLLLSHNSPISISPDGVCSSGLPYAIGRPSPANQLMALSFSEIDTVEAIGNIIFINGSRYARCSSLTQAQRIAALICDVKAEEFDNRETLIRGAIAETLDINKARERLNNLYWELRPLGLLSLLMFVNVFLLAPIAVTYFGLIPCSLPLSLYLIEMALLMATIYYGLSSSYSHDKTIRISNTVKILLFPPAAIRSATTLSYEALSEFSPIVIALILSEQRFATFINSLMRRLKYPLCSVSENSNITAINDWYYGLLFRLHLDLLLSVGYVGSDQILSPPQRKDEALYYCPRCRCQYNTKRRFCAECLRVELEKFIEVS